MPKDVGDSLTDLQLTMIERALDSGRWRLHPVDLRLSIPLLWWRFYVVLLAGPEKRSPERRRSEQINRPLRAVANTVLFAVFLLLVIPAALGVVQLISMDWSGR